MANISPAGDATRANRPLLASLDVGNGWGSIGPDRLAGLGLACPGCRPRGGNPRGLGYSPVSLGRYNDIHDCEQLSGSSSSRRTHPSGNLAVAGYPPRTGPRSPALASRLVVSLLVLAAGLVSAFHLLADRLFQILPPSYISPGCAHCMIDQPATLVAATVCVPEPKGELPLVLDIKSIVQSHILTCSGGKTHCVLA